MVIGNQEAIHQAVVLLHVGILISLHGISDMITVALNHIGWLLLIINQNKFGNLFEFPISLEVVT